MLLGRAGRVRCRTGGGRLSNLLLLLHTVLQDLQVTWCICHQLSYGLGGTQHGIVLAGLAQWSV